MTQEYIMAAAQAAMELLRSAVQDRGVRFTLALRQESTNRSIVLTDDPCRSAVIDGLNRQEWPVVTSGATTAEVLHNPVVDPRTLEEAHIRMEKKMVRDLLADLLTPAKMSNLNRPFDHHFDVPAVNMRDSDPVNG